MSEQIISKWRSIKDIRKALIDHGIHDQWPNPELLLKKIVDENDSSLMDTLKALGDAEEARLLSDEYKEKRKRAYSKEGADLDSIIEAIWEKVVEGDSTKADAIQLKRLEIKNRFKKP